MNANKHRLTMTEHARPAHLPAAETISVTPLNHAANLHSFADKGFF
jgi:hypothetical protein